MKIKAHNNEILPLLYGAASFLAMVIIFSNGIVGAWF